MLGYELYATHVQYRYGYFSMALMFACNPIISPVAHRSSAE
jgi:hypothetical protein